MLQSEYDLAVQKYWKNKGKKNAKQFILWKAVNQKLIFAEKSEKLFWVKGFWHRWVELHETQIFFPPALSGIIVQHFGM